MKACVETFKLGADDLSAFLRNAERETALTTLMLREPRFSALTSEEQNLLTAISKAGTSKRRYLYAVAIVGLYGLLERFVDSVLEEYIAQLSTSASHYDHLPEPIRKNHLPVSLELLKAINDETYHGEMDAASVIANLHSCLSSPASFRLNGAAFVLHRGNINLDKIRSFLGGVGITSPLRRLSVMPSLDTFFSDSDPPRYPRLVSDEDLTLMLSPIDDLVDRRNAIAHGVVDDIESVGLLLARVDFLLALVQAMHELLQHELLPLEVAASGTQALGKPIAVFGGKVVCFESTNCRVAVGDRIAAKTGDTLMPYRVGEILDLQVNHIPHRELRLTEPTQFGIKIAFNARDNHTFFVLQPTSDDIRSVETPSNAQANVEMSAA